ncbi:NAD(P)/FAD-dependent oxidoreductase [Pseudarthrobacter sp. NBSH8]|uniref:FAD-dependent oxidoreductase n=1 Tax=Pseudarthrobacter sp. NBSH8 TaxID=2596911 RepID=UPI001625F327|nr:NAD(P)/FAD-dependent oxidoreductase [Pseudarthrobacter sp. NBSH8]QNE14700.1 FAD-dependent monooxygenase [Pseudarthrobacter sp. NBSH8]
MVDVVIVGGGPVGLYLAALLLQEGVAVRVLDQRVHRESHSRAIGIHPPALAALDRVDVAGTMIGAGVQIRGGIAVSGGKTVGSMSFASVSECFPFVLSLPQFTTEYLLEQRVHELDSAALVRGARVMEIADDGGLVTVHAEATKAGGAGARITSRLVVAADGSRSRMRGLLGIQATSRSYPDHYVMGDYADSGANLYQAVLYLEGEGIVESFPLPGGLRRWVVRIPRPAPFLDAVKLARMVHQRTGIRPDPATNSMLSSFSPRSTVACRSVAGRAVLIGDAAHELSPIGGQGMNLGWLDAAELAPIICASLAGKPVGQRLRAYSTRRRKAALVARWQTEVNMTLGRPLAPPFLALRNAAVSAVSGMPPVNRMVARRFTMQ